MAHGILLALFAVFAGSPQTASDQTFQCFTHHGRFSTQNGITRTIWLIGTKRRVAVENEFPPLLEQQLERYMRLDSEEHSYIFGDFELCPTAPDIPGHMRPVRLMKAEKLVIQSADGKRPPFRLLSTWPNQ